MTVSCRKSRYCYGTALCEPIDQPASLPDYITPSLGNRSEFVPTSFMENIRNMVLDFKSGLASYMFTSINSLYFRLYT